MLYRVCHDREIGLCYAHVGTRDPYLSREHLYQHGFGPKSYSWTGLARLGCPLLKESACRAELRFPPDSHVLEDDEDLC